MKHWFVPNYVSCESDILKLTSTIVYLFNKGPTQTVHRFKLQPLPWSCICISLGLTYILISILWNSRVMYFLNENLYSTADPGGYPPFSLTLRDLDKKLRQENSLLLLESNIYTHGMSISDCWEKMFMSGTLLQAFPMGSRGETSGFPKLENHIPGNNYCH